MDRTEDVERFAEMFKALSNPNRLRIFRRLVNCCAPGSACTPEQQPQCVGSVGADLGISPSTLSHHLKELRQAGVIKVERSGQSIRCWANPEIIQALFDFAHDAARGGSCCAGLPADADETPAG